MATQQVATLTLKDCSSISLNRPSFFRQIKHPHASSSCCSLSRRQLMTQTAKAITLVLSSKFLRHFSATQALAAVQQPQRLYLPIHPHAALLDIVSAPHPYHGLQMKAEGSRWVPLSRPSAEDEDNDCRFKSISFNGKEGRILLDAPDAGENRKRISLSSQLPGDMRYHGDSIKTGRKDERPRFFDLKVKSLCWAKAATVPGRHPDRWRKDAAGNVVCRRFHSCQGCLCYEYDHIIPFSKGGPSMEDNCQILQTRVNRFKADKDEVNMTQLKGYSCDIQFTDKELDIIEMAVYGDVLRPGNLCRVGTIDKIHGTYKSTDRSRLCKLP